MLDDIKDSIDQFQQSNGEALSERDLMGINKIHFELDLLKRVEVKPKKKSRVVEGDGGI